MSAAPEFPPEVQPVSPADEQRDPEDGAGAGFIEVIVTEADVGQRLDQILTHHIAHLSRARIQALIKAGAVTVLPVETTGAGASATLAPNVIFGPMSTSPLASGAVTTKLRPGIGTRIALEIPELEPAEPEPQVMALDIVYEDAELIVVNKPAGMVVHPGAGHADGTLVNGLLAHCGASLAGVGGVRRPGIVHRLDRDTSGLLVVAKSDHAHRHLSAQFASHGADGRLLRRYRALVWGGFDRPTGEVTARIGRSDTNRTRMAVVGPNRGRHAHTDYRVLRTFAPDEVGAVSEIAVELATGRTHQIRVHMASIRHPVLGDPLYGATHATKLGHVPGEVACAVNALGRQALHAETLGFQHPTTDAAMYFESKLPDDMANILDALNQACV